jgi:hypothetical protein
MNYLWKIPELMILSTFLAPVCLEKLSADIHEADLFPVAE